MPQERYLTAKEVADRFALTVDGLYTQRWRNVAPGSLGVKIGRRLLFRESELEEFFNHEKRSQAKAG